MRFTHLHECTACLRCRAHPDNKRCCVLTCKAQSLGCELETAFHKQINYADAYGNQCGCGLI